jgi:hypothetical protein
VWTCLYRITVTLLVLAGVWALPLEWDYCGGPGNYDVHRRGLFGWERVYELRSGLFASMIEPTRLVNSASVGFTIATSVLVTLAGAGWVMGRGSGRWVLVIPAVLFAVSLWWPDVNGCRSGDEGYAYSRGAFGYLVEYRQQYEPSEFPPWSTPVKGRLGVDWHGVKVTAVASAVVIMAGWLAGQFLCRPRTKGERPT